MELSLESKMDIPLHQAYNVEFKKCKSFSEDFKKNSQEIMTSSTASANSSLTSPGDSGVQLLDSESELTSVMSVSGIVCDIDSVPSLESDTERDDRKLKKDINKIDDEKADVGKEKYDSHSERKLKINVDDSTLIVEIFECTGSIKNEKDDTNKKSTVMTKSDIVNQNIDHFETISLSTSTEKLSSETKQNTNTLCNELIQTLQHEDKPWLSENGTYTDFYTKYGNCKKGEPNGKLSNEYILQMEDIVKSTEKTEDLMNISLNSYELLDYTIPNKVNMQLPDKVDDMHVSLSEEVNENLKVALTNVKESTPELTSVQEVQVPVDEQIVFRRQRKKKSKSDTPKKRVSFHEDILNSTKIDDIHINHGFITIEPDVSVSFFQRGFKKKPDVVKGRYSWAAEGDAPFYEMNNPEREVKSDIYIHTSRFSSSSSSSTSSSIDEEYTSTSNDSVIKKDPTFVKPRASCLKKTKNKRYIDTNIVEESRSLHKKKSEANLLDGNIFGSLKSILNFSSSVPIAERGVPEGQEDAALYSSSHDSTISRSRRSSGNFENTENPAPIKKIGTLNIELAKTNLKLTRSEGFYPNYPNPDALPSNIILCDSNVYEHKGISYSYEYDNFQKSFEQQQPKSSTIYQMILKEFNIFKKKAKDEPLSESADDFEFLTSTPTKENQNIELIEETKSQKSLSKYMSSTKLDWSDNETISDLTETTTTSSTKHLNSPKHKINKANHYAVQNFKYESTDECQSKSLSNLKPSSSKNSLINRFLRNVTLKKIMDLKQQKKWKYSRRYMSLYIKGVQVKPDVNYSLDRQIEEEILNGRAKIYNSKACFDPKMLMKVRNEIFRDKMETLIRIFPVHSAYTTAGESKALSLFLTNTTLYICSSRSDSSYSNHFVLPYSELNTILIGPNAQTIHISNYDKDMQCIITTGCGNITGDIVGQLEMTMRRDKNKPKLPAVKQLTMRDMANLRRAICKQTSVDKEEEYFHYSIVRLQEFNTEIHDTPLGPNKEGPLMFKISETEARWETAYFILKAGVLYMLSSPSHRVPMRVLPLINGACQGARRIYNYPRPHTFQLVIGHTMLHLAAPDEYVASDWLQALVHAASGCYNNRERIVAQSCSLLMTSEHIITVREAFPCNISSSVTKGYHEPIKGAHALSCASISNITACRLPSAEQSWCILEFACREVHESSGDWILYFTSNSELEIFLSTLEMIWAYHNDQGDSFPLSTIPETDSINRKCVDAYNSLQNAWPLVSYSPTF